MSAPPPQLGRARGQAGLFILVGLGLFVFAVLQAGLLEPFLRSTSTLRILLPEAGLAGLARGAQVQLFGSPIGEVTRVVIRPDEPFYAEVEIEDDKRAFIREDSRVTVRRQFGIAGAAFLDISRGRGEPLDWDYAVLEASTERAPTEGVEALIVEARERILPLITEATHAVDAAGDLLVTLQNPESNLQQMLARANAVSAEIQSGAGTFGRLLTDDTLVRGLETTVTLLNTQVQSLEPVIANADQLMENVVGVSGNVARGTEDLGPLLATLERTLRSTDALMVELAAATPAITEVAQGAGRSVETLPDVLRRTGQTLAQLEELLDALRRSWLVGGGGTPAGTAATPMDVRP